jgi:hypothetical protein
MRFNILPERLTPWKGQLMIASRFSVPLCPRLAIVPPFLVSLVFSATTASAQGQPSSSVSAPKLSDSERARKLTERDQIRAEVIKLANAGKLEEAVAASIKELAATREALGELHDDVVASLVVLSRRQEARGDWAAARNALTDVLDIRQRQPDQRDWRITDARLALANLDRRAALTPARPWRSEARCWERCTPNMPQA